MNFKTSAQIDGSIAELTSKIQELEAEKRMLESLTPVQRLATIMHDSTCGANHTDGCSWYYEISKGIPDWFGSAHARYHKRADAALYFMAKQGRGGSDNADIYIVEQLLRIIKS